MNKKSLSLLGKPDFIPFDQLNGLLEDVDLEMSEVERQIWLDQQSAREMGKSYQIGFIDVLQEAIDCIEGVRKKIGTQDPPDWNHFFSNYLHGQALKNPKLTRHILLFSEKALSFKKSSEDRQLAWQLAHYIDRLFTVRGRVDFILEGAPKEGGMGSVYPFREEDLALKVFRDDEVAHRKRMGLFLLHSAEGIDRVRELSQYPHMANYLGRYSARKKGDRHNSHMDIYQKIEGGRTMSEIIRSIPLQAGRNQKVKEIFLQLLDPLIYLHKKGVVHADIKPENILIDSDGQAFWIDYDLMCYDNTTLLAVSHIGTEGYRSPEAYGEFISTKSDIYSLGASIADLLYQSFIYQYNTKGEPVFMDDFSASPWWNIVKVCMSKNASKRPCAEQLKYLIESLRLSNGAI